MSRPPELATLADRSPQGIAGAFGRAIRSGDLAPGDRLPTVREVAAELGVSPATVSAAWQALRRTGVVVSRGRAGTFVRETPARLAEPAPARTGGRPAPTGCGWTSRAAHPTPSLLPSLGPAFGRVSARAGTGVYQDEPVLPALRTALEATWPYPTESITVVDGATDGVSRVLEQCVHLGDRVALESPGYPPFYDLVESLGAEIVPLELDDSGVRPESLRAALDTRPVAVVLQPRAQNPTGISMSPERAHTLAGVLTTRRRQPIPWIVEDDHSGAISTSPDVSLGTHLPDHVVHVRSFSKSHGPDLRIAALGGPSVMVDAARGATHARAGLDVADGADDPARPAHRGPVDGRGVRGATAVLRTPARPRRSSRRARRRRQHARRHQPVAPGPRRARSPAPPGRRGHPGGRRHARSSPLASSTPHVRVTSGLVDPEHADEVAAALVAAAAAG